MPGSIAPNQDVSVVVTRDGIASDPVTVLAANVGEVAPAAATYTTDGKVFHAVVQAPDGTLRPLKRGEAATLYATGLGKTTPTVPDGDASPANPPAVAVNQVEILMDH